MDKQGKENKRKGKMRLLAVALSLCLFITACPHLPEVLTVHAAVTSGSFVSANITWSLDDDGTLTISGNEAMASLQKNQVSAAWSGIRDDVRHVVIENGITGIGVYNFYGFTALESVIIPGSVTIINDNAFEECTALKTVQISKGLKTLRYSAFKKCKALTSIEIPNSVTEIMGDAFYSCMELKSVIIPDSVKKIGSNAFCACNALTSVEIPDSVTTLSMGAFQSCTSLETVKLSKNITRIEGSTFSSCKITSIEIPDGVTYIDGFSYCRKLKSVRIPDSVTTIGDYAFIECSALETVTIPDSVETIDSNAFRSCTALKFVTIPKDVTTVGEKAFSGCSNAAIIYEDVLISDTMVSFGSQWKDNTGASIIYTAEDGEAELSIEACSTKLTELHIPATVNGNQPISCNYEDYPDITVIHDGPHNFVDDICEICGEPTEEKKVADAMEVVIDAMEEIEATNATTREEIQAILDEALEEAGIDLDDVTVTVEDFDKTEAEKYEDGIIEGTIAVVSNQDADVQAWLEFELCIDELITNEEMVADAKRFVERVLGEIEATNATTREEIQEIINEAYDEEEYIYDVEITVGELTKTEADMTAPGSILGAVSIVSDNDENVTASVPVNLVIAKLPAPVTGITLDRESVTLTKDGETIQLTAGVVPEYADNKNVIWSTDNAEVAAVDATGKVSAVGNGTCTVTAKTEDGGKTASCQVTVSLPVKTPTPTKTVPPVKTTPPVKTAPPDITPTPEQTNPPTATASPDVPKKITPPKKAPVSNAAFRYGGLKVGQSGKKIHIAWERAAGADGYDVYVQYCGKDFTAKSIKAIRSGATTKTTVTKINGKALNLKKHFKVYVSAYKRVDGRKVKLGKTVAAHIVGSKAADYANAKTIRVGKSAYRLKKGKSVNLRAKTVTADKGKKQLANAHTKEFRYASDNKKVATVSGKGKIKAVGTGTCTIYVYARNGYARKVKVTVG